MFKYSKFIAVFFIGLSLFVSSTGTISAESSSQEMTRRNENSFRSLRPSASPSSRQQVCEAREAAIKTRSTNLSRMASNMLDKFDLIAKRVQEYYTSSGKTVSNYESLVAAVATNKAAVQAALTAAQADVAGFNCSLENPKAHMTKFQTDMKVVKSALKEYRTSIKNLIVAIRSVVGEEQSDNKKSPRPSLSPKPTKTPNVNANPNSLRRNTQ